MDNITLTFFSNFLMHHQTPFCEAMARLLGANFKFVATERIPKERLGMGYSDLSKSASYAVNSYESEENYKKALELGLNSDVVVIGDAPDEFIEERLKQNKLTFRYSERYFKEGRWRILDPRVFKARYKQDIRYKKKNLYMLCASAYTAPDCRFIGCYKNKMFKWGYFPTVKRYESIESVINAKTSASLIWAARFLDWKHPEAALTVAKRLKEDGYKFTLNMIGGGELENKIKERIAKYGLKGCVKLLGTMPPEKVREYMEKAEIFLFTSDKNEGWGAVLNESMNSGCAVVASSAIGSVPYLIKDGENGLIYKDGNVKDLYKKVKFLLDNAEYRKNLGKNAYDTLKTEWNAEIAAERLLGLIDSINCGKETPYKSGPCSRD